MATRKPASKWDVPPRRGEYDHLLQDIRDEVARMTPPPPPTPRPDPPRLPRVHVAVEIVDKRALARAKRRQGQWAMAVLLWTVVIVVLGMLWASGGFR